MSQRNQSLVFPFSKREQLPGINQPKLFRTSNEIDYEGGGEGGKTITNSHTPTHGEPNNNKLSAFAK